MLPSSLTDRETPSPLVEDRERPSSSSVMSRRNLIKLLLLGAVTSQMPGVYDQAVRSNAKDLGGLEEGDLLNELRSIFGDNEVKADDRVLFMIQAGTNYTDNHETILRMADIVHKSNMAKASVLVTVDDWVIDGQDIDSEAFNKIPLNEQLDSSPYIKEKYSEMERKGLAFPGLKFRIQNATNSSLEVEDVYEKVAIAEDYKMMILVAGNLFLADRLDLQIQEHQQGYRFSHKLPAFQVFNQGSSSSGSTASDLVSLQVNSLVSRFYPDFEKTKLYKLLAEIKWRLLSLVQ